MPLLDVSRLGRKTLCIHYMSFLWKLTKAVLHPTRHNTRQSKWLYYKQYKSLVYPTQAGSAARIFPLPISNHIFIYSTRPHIHP